MLFEQISTIEELKEDIKGLKNKYSNSSCNITTDSPENMVTESSCPPPSAPTPDLEKIHTQLSQLTSSVNNHQKFLENKEKADRMNNLIIVGLEETGESEDAVSVSNNFFSEKLDLTDIRIEKARRLGKSQSKTRPILVAFNSQLDRKKVLSNRSKLAGSNIYINFDLTRDQLKEQQKLREIRKQLIKLPEFKNKKITIYQNKLHVDRQPISPEILRAAGINQ